MRIVCSSQRYVYYVADCVCCICCDFKATTVSRWYAGKELKAPSMNLYEVALLSLPCLSASYFDSQVHRSGHWVVDRCGQGRSDTQGRLGAALCRDTLHVSGT